MSTDARRLSPSDRALAEALLREAPFAYVAMVEDAPPPDDAPGRSAPVSPPVAARPYAVPMNFAYEPAAETAAAPCAPREGAGEDSPGLGRLYLHTGEGRKSEALARNPRVCATIAADAAFDQGPDPCNDGFSFRSVLVEGRATLLEDRGRQEQALRAIVAKYDPGAVDTPFTEDALAETLVYAVSIEALSYKARPRRSAQ